MAGDLHERASAARGRLTAAVAAATASILLAGVVAARGAAPAGSCVECHRALAGNLRAPVETFAEDVHAEHGLGCADCHGGDAREPSLQAMERSRGFLGAPGKKQVPAFCGRCHSDPAYMRRFNPGLPTDQLSRYWTSPHGKRLREGDERVAECVSCHGVHDIRPASDARSPVSPTRVPQTCGHCHADPALMADSGHGIHELEAYRRSVHGRALLVKGDPAAPACNDCHGNHGAFPPNVNSISEVCGGCHAGNRDLFVASPHHEPFRRLALPGCATCHGRHEVLHPTDAMLGDTAEAICTRCHGPQMAPAGLAAARAMRADIEKLEAEIASAREVLAHATRVGMEVNEARFQLKEAGGVLVRARSEVHAFSPGKLHAVVGEGLDIARRCRAAGEAALAEMGVRRRAVAIPLAVLALAIVLLIAKIRAMDR